jgi:hypothetical protein
VRCKLSIIPSKIHDSNCLYNKYSTEKVECRRFEEKHSGALQENVSNLSYSIKNLYI